MIDGGVFIFVEGCSDEKVVKILRAMHAHYGRVESHCFFVSCPVVQAVDGFGVEAVEDGRRDVGRVVADVDDGLDAAGSDGLLSSAGGTMGDDMAEGLNDEGGDVVVGVASSAEVGVKLFDVLIPHVCVAV